ncbi:hypothetical protein V466_00180 [Pseudomonas mandelii PD30]|uniref:Uncharacterized protein n=1 Tax=Pseudomonas mandelii PD30 TaxID=1419583 RepID=A0A059LAY1_9PSED|nr:hypothetical protein V466_00180 [Pseudomonas mandelii PD30]
MVLCKFNRAREQKLTISKKWMHQAQEAQWARGRLAI